MHAGGLTQAPSSIASLVTSTCIRDILKILKNQLPSSDHKVGSVTNVNDRFLFFGVSPRLIPTCYDLGFRSQPQGAYSTSPLLAHRVVGSFNQIVQVYQWRTPTLLRLLGAAGLQTVTHREFRKDNTALVKTRGSPSVVKVSRGFHQSSYSLQPFQETE